MNNVIGVDLNGCVVVPTEDTMAGRAVLALKNGDLLCVVGMNVGTDIPSIARIHLDAGSRALCVPILGPPRTEPDVETVVPSEWNLFGTKLVLGYSVHFQKWWLFE